MFSTDGRRCTPLVRASDLLHAETVKVLLRYGADVALVDQTQPKPSLSTALDFVIRKPGWYGNREHTTLDAELFEILVDAGCQISNPYLLRDIIESDGRVDLAYKYVRNEAAVDHILWAKSGAYIHLMLHLDEPASLDFVQFLARAGSNLSYDVSSIRPMEGARTIVEAAAARGLLETVKLLIDLGAYLSENTLPCAIASANEELVQYLLKKGAKVDCVGSLGSSPLAAAIRLGRDAEHQEHIRKFLLEHGALAGLQNSDLFLSVLIAASEKGDLDFIKFLTERDDKHLTQLLGVGLSIAMRNEKDEVAHMLIDAGADTNLVSSQRNSKWTCLFGLGPPLLYALKNRKADLVCALLDADANPNYYYDKMYFSGDCSALPLAVAWGDSDIITGLINAGVAFYQGEHTPVLQIAIEKLDYGLIDLLLRAGANINHTDSRCIQRTALAAATRRGDIPMTRFLLKRGADPYDPGALAEAAAHSTELTHLILEAHRARYPVGHKLGCHNLRKAIDTGDAELFQTFVGKELDVHGHPHDRSPFAHAILKAGTGDIRFLEIILQHGYSPEAFVTQDKFDFFDKAPTPKTTAFLVAVATGSLASVQLFIRFNAKINFPTGLGIKRTPLQRAAECGHFEVVELLIRSGAEVNAPAASKGGATALQLAAIGGYNAVIELLLSYGADVNAAPSKIDGRTPIEGAAEHGRIDTVALLLEAGAASYGKDRTQLERAISLAQEQGFTYIRDMLSEYLLHGKLGGQPNFDDLIDWEAT